MLTYRSKALYDQAAALILLTEEQVKEKKYPMKSDIAPIVANKQFSGESGQIFPTLVNKKLVVLVGIGKKSVSLTKVRTAVRNALLSSYVKKLPSVELIPHEEKEETLKAIVEGIVIGTYVWNKYKTEERAKAVAQKMVVVTGFKKAGEHTEVVAQATNFARNLTNENASVANSSFLEKTIKDIVKGHKNVQSEILKEKQMKEKGLGLHLAVNKGSENEPCLAIVKYAGAGASQGYTALVGKGITFDTGGINLKPSGSIETMRYDMSGTAAVIGTLKAVTDLKIKKNILFVCAIAENLIDSKAYFPGDVISGYAKKTVEIGNTDAEGRLVLADAIAYVTKNYKPKRLIDLATLTGACVVALGNDYAGLFTTDEGLSKDLVHSSNATDDRIWRLPIYEELKDHVKSKIADIRNTGLPKGTGGAISAAEFLHQFTGGTPWAHLDIAGTAFVDGDSRWYYGHGGTGFGVRLLTHYLENYA